jgi:hypothetical protein
VLLLCVVIVISVFSFDEVAVVTVWGRRVGWLLVLLINSFFVFFSILRTSQRSQQWQYQYVMACVSQFIFEVFLFESINVIWVHWVIPRLIQRDVTVVVNSLKSLVASSLANAVDWQQPFDTTDHFFVSKAIARKYPHLLESAIVQSFHSYFPPGRMSNHWGSTRGAMLDRKRNRALSFFARVLSVTAAVIGVLQFVGTLNINVQTFLMSLVLPMALVAAYVAAAFIIGNPLYLALLVGALALLVMRHFMKNAQQDRTGEAADKELLVMPSSFTTGQQRLLNNPGSAAVTAKAPSHLSVRRDVAVANGTDTSQALVFQHGDVSGGVDRHGSHESLSENVKEEEMLCSNASSAENESDCSRDESEVAIRKPSMTSLDSLAVVDRRSGPHEQASAALSQEEEHSIRLERQKAAIAVLVARRERIRPDSSTASRDIFATRQHEKEQEIEILPVENVLASQESEPQPASNQGTVVKGPAAGSMITSRTRSYDVSTSIGPLNHHHHHSAKHKDVSNMQIINLDSSSGDSCDFSDRVDSNPRAYDSKRTVSRNHSSVATGICNEKGSASISRADSHHAYPTCASDGRGGGGSGGSMGGRMRSISFEKNGLYGADEAQMIDDHAKRSLGGGVGDDDSSCSGSDRNVIKTISEPVSEVKNSGYSSGVHKRSQERKGEVLRVISYGDDDDDDDDSDDSDSVDSDSDVSILDLRGLPMASYVRHSSDSEVDSDDGDALGDGISSDSDVVVTRRHA